MLVMCLICRESLSQSPGDQRCSRNVTINCGHIFHYGCLNRWWNSVIQRCPTAHLYCPMGCENKESPRTAFQLHPLCSGQGQVTTEAIQQIQTNIAQQEAEIKKKESEIEKLCQACDHS